MAGVKQERSGWRDQDLSLRHRQWGVNCPGVDLDFVLLEYHHSKPVALVEYKHEKAPPQYASTPNYQALISLGNNSSIPVFACRYQTNWENWTVTPLNAHARRILPERQQMNERGWVGLLYRSRGLSMSDQLWQDIQIKV